MNILLLVFVVAIISGPAAFAVRSRCRRSPGARPWLIAVAIVILAGVGVAIPHINEVVPRGMRESPAGFIPLLAAMAVLGILALGALGTIVGVGWSIWSPGGESDD